MCCSICYKLSSDDDPAWIHLPCSHSVCLNCFQKMASDEVNCALCKVREPEDILAEIANPQKKYCPLHSKNFEFICETCNKFICENCVQENHSDHRHEHRRIFEDRVKPKLTESAGLLDDFKNKKNKLKSKLEQKEKQLLLINNFSASILNAEYQTNKEEIAHFESHFQPFVQLEDQINLWETQKDLKAAREIENFSKDRLNDLLMTPISEPESSGYIEAIMWHFDSLKSNKNPKISQKKIDMILGIHNIKLTEKEEIVSFSLLDDFDLNLAVISGFLDFFPQKIVKISVFTERSDNDSTLRDLKYVANKAELFFKKHTCLKNKELILVYPESDIRFQESQIKEKNGSYKLLFKNSSHHNYCEQNLNGHTKDWGNNQSLESKLKQAKREIEEKDQQIEVMCTMIDRTIESNDEARNFISILYQMLISIQVKYKKLEKTEEYFRLQHYRLNKKSCQEKDEMQSESDKKSEDIKKLEQELKEIKALAETEESSHGATVRTLNSFIRNNDNSIFESATKIGILEQKLEQKSKELNSAEKALKDLTDKLKEEKKKNEDLEDKISKLNDKITQMEKDHKTETNNITMKFANEKIPIRKIIKNGLSLFGTSQS